MIQIPDQLSYRATLPIDTRMQFTSLEDMRNYPDAYLYDGAITFCTATQQWYRYKVANSSDSITGRWRPEESQHTKEIFFFRDNNIYDMDGNVVSFAQLRDLVSDDNTIVIIQNHNHSLLPAYCAANEVHFAAVLEDVKLGVLVVTPTAITYSEKTLQDAAYLATEATLDTIDDSHYPSMQFLVSQLALKDDIDSKKIYDYRALHSEVYQKNLEDFSVADTSSWVDYFLQLNSDWVSKTGLTLQIPWNDTTFILVTEFIPNDKLKGLLPSQGLYVNIDFHATEGTGITLTPFQNTVVTPASAEDIAQILKEAFGGYPSQIPMTKVTDHFFKGVFETLDYDAARYYFEHYDSSHPFKWGACSAMAKENIVGRNFDWLYNEQTSVVVKVPAAKNRHASIGMSLISRTDAELMTNVDFPNLPLIPFLVVDGINDSGFLCIENLVPTGDYGHTTGTNEGYKPGMCALMIPRYLLDKAGSVDEAIALLNDLNIWSISQFEFHFLLKDSTKTVVIEFVNNELKVIDTFVDNKPIMTNFYLYGWDGTRDTLTPYAQGIERGQILSTAYNNVFDESTMHAAMREVNYTHAYNPVNGWYSEFASNTEEWGDLTKDSPPEDYAPIMAHFAEIFQHRVRDGQTWQTVHQTVYNMAQKSFGVWVQEDNMRYVFTLEGEL